MNHQSLLLLGGHGVAHGRSSSTTEQRLPLGAPAFEITDVWSQQVKVRGCCEQSGALRLRQLWKVASYPFEGPH